MKCFGKKIVTVLIAVVMLFCGCNIGGEVDNLSGQQAVKEYVPEDIAISMSAIDYFYAKIYADGIYAPLQKEKNVIMKYSAEDNSESRIEIVWPEEYISDEKRLPYISQISVGVDGSIYLVAGIYLNKKYNAYPHLCKFTSEGQMVYIKDITEQMVEAEVKSWSSVFLLEADDKGRVCISHKSKVFLYDEAGNYYATIQVIDDSDQFFNPIMDMQRGFDNNIYLYYPSGWGSGRIDLVDFETVSLTQAQEVMYGVFFAFKPDDGFVITDTTGIYDYSETLPTVERKVRELFTWQQYQVYESGIREVGFLKDGSIVVVVHSARDEYCRMLRWKPNEKK